MRVKYLKPILFAVCLLPAARLVVDGLHSQLGDNPLEMITYETGDWSMLLMMATLAITPLRKITVLHSLISLRRMLGLFAFFYASCHGLTFFWLDKHFAIDAILLDVAKRRFILAGFFALLLLIPLAITSTRQWIRRLGKNWAKLHRVFYASAAAAVIHYLWLAKDGDIKPYAWLLIFTVLMLWRLRPLLRPPGKQTTSAPAAS